MSSPSDLIFGKIAVQYKFLNKEQLAFCFEEQKRVANQNVSLPFRDILLTQGYITSGQYNIVLKTQLFTEMRLEDKELGNKISNLGWLSSETIEKLLHEQEKLFYEKGSLIRLEALVCQKKLIDKSMLPALKKLKGMVEVIPEEEPHNKPLLGFDLTSSDIRLAPSSSKPSPKGGQSDSKVPHVCPDCWRPLEFDSVFCPYCKWQKQIVIGTLCAAVLCLLILLIPNGPFTLIMFTPSAQSISLIHHEIYKNLPEETCILAGNSGTVETFIKSKKSQEKVIYWLPAFIGPSISQGVRGGGFLILIIFSAPILVLGAFLARYIPWLLSFGPLLIFLLFAFFFWDVGALENPITLNAFVFYVFLSISMIGLLLGRLVGGKLLCRALSLIGSLGILFLLPNPLFWVKQGSESGFPFLQGYSSIFSPPGMLLVASVLTISWTLFPRKKFATWILSVYIVFLFFLFFILSSAFVHVWGVNGKSILVCFGVLIQEFLGFTIMLLMLSSLSLLIQPAAFFKREPWMDKEISEYDISIAR